MLILAISILTGGAYLITTDSEDMNQIPSVTGEYIEKRPLYYNLSDENPRVYIKEGEKYIDVMEEFSNVE